MGFHDFHQIDRLFAALLGVLGLGAIAVRAAETPGQGAPVPLVPWPRELTMGDGETALTAGSRVVAGSDALNPLARVLSDEIYLTTALRLDPAEAEVKPGDITLAIDPSLKADQEVVEVTADGASVRGGTYNAAALASVSLLQSLRADASGVRMPRMTIHDEPYAPYTGVMVDIARGYHSMDYLRQYVLLCRMYKMRYLHLHMTDHQSFMFPSEAFPKMGSSADWKERYTLQELRDLVKFADDRGVIIVPELETLGHSGAMMGGALEIFGAKDEKTGTYRSLGGIINLTNDAIYPALDTIIGEMCDVFKSSPYFHIGCDETDDHKLRALPGYAAYVASLGPKANPETVFINKVNAIVKKYGKKTIAWEGGGTYAGCDKDVIIMDYAGGNDQDTRRGYSVISHPGDPGIWSSVEDLYDWNMYISSAGPRYGSCKPGPLTLGAEMGFWEQPGSDQVVRLLRIKGAPRCERVWNPDAGRTCADFRARFAVVDDLLDRIMLPVRINADGLTKMQPWTEVNEQIEGGSSIFEHELTVHLDPAIVLPGEKIYYTLDHSEPTTSSLLYTGPFKLTEKDTKLFKQHAATWDGPMRVEVRAAMFAGAHRVGFVRSFTYNYDYLDKTPRRVKFTLYGSAPGPRMTQNCYQLPDSIKRLPEDVSGLTVLYSGLEGRLSFQGMPNVRMPGYGFLKIGAKWDGTLVLDKAGEYEFQCDTPSPTLVIDGKSVVGQSKENSGKITLTAGEHPFMMTMCGQGIGASLQYKAPGADKFKEVYEELKVIEPAASN